MKFALRKTEGPLWVHHLAQLLMFSESQLLIPKTRIIDSNLAVVRIQ